MELIPRSVQDAYRRLFGIWHESWGHGYPHDSSAGPTGETGPTGATGPAGDGAPTGADYLVGTANGSLSAEIVVGTTPGGELGGAWATPTVDDTHAGSTHHPDVHDLDSHPTRLHSDLTIVPGDGHSASIHGHNATGYISVVTGLTAQTFAPV